MARLFQVKKTIDVLNELTQKLEEKKSKEEGQIDIPSKSGLDEARERILKDTFVSPLLADNLLKATDKSISEIFKHNLKKKSDVQLSIRVLGTQVARIVESLRRGVLDISAINASIVNNVASMWKSFIFIGAKSSIEVATLDSNYRDFNALINTGVHGLISFRQFMTAVAANDMIRIPVDQVIQLYNELKQWFIKDDVYKLFTITNEDISGELRTLLIEYNTNVDAINYQRVIPIQQRILEKLIIYNAGERPQELGERVDLPVTQRDQPILQISDAGIQILADRAEASGRPVAVFSPSLIQRNEGLQISTEERAMITARAPSNVHGGFFGRYHVGLMGGIWLAASYDLHLIKLIFDHNMGLLSILVPPNILRQYATGNVVAFNAYYGDLMDSLRHLYNFFTTEPHIAVESYRTVPERKAPLNTYFGGNPPYLIAQLYNLNKEGEAIYVAALQVLDEVRRRTGATYDTITDGLRMVEFKGETAEAIVGSYRAQLPDEINANITYSQAHREHLARTPEDLLSVEERMRRRPPRAASEPRVRIPRTPEPAPRVAPTFATIEELGEEPAEDEPPAKPRAAKKKEKEPKPAAKKPAPKAGGKRGKKAGEGLEEDLHDVADKIVEDADKDMKHIVKNIKQSVDDIPLDASKRLLSLMAGNKSKLLLDKLTEDINEGNLALTRKQRDSLLDDIKIFYGEL